MILILNAGTMKYGLPNLPVLKCIRYQLHLLGSPDIPPRWPRRSHIGRKISQTPNFSRQNMGCARPSQKLNSPTKLTECALGAHTAKRVPHSPLNRAVAKKHVMSFLMFLWPGQPVLACEYEAPCGGHQTLRSKAPSTAKWMKKVWAILPRAKIFTPWRKLEASLDTHA